MKTLPTLLKQALEINQLTLSDEMRAQLVRYLTLMLTWNKVFNLTAITSPREMVYLHLIDSLKVGPYLHGKTCLDIGSGAGLPGLPLAIVYPHTSWTLLDKSSKKTRFLIQTIAELHIKNAQVVHVRGEEFAPAIRFDSILARAFASLKAFAMIGMPFLSPQGEMLAMKGKLPSAELAFLPENIATKEIVRLNILGMDIERHLIILKEKKGYAWEK